MEPQQNLSFDESVKQVMKSLPPVIRNYITGEKYTTVARGLMAKYKLRVDQGGVLEREILLLLMGVENPDEFMQALAEDAQLNKVVIVGIVQDVNDQIFVPLRKEEEGGAIEPQIQPVAPKVVPQPVTHFNLQNKIPVPKPVVPAPASKKDWSNLPPAPMKGTLPPKEFLPRPVEASSVGGPRPVEAPSVVGPRTSSLGDVVRSVLAAPKPTDTKMLEDHEEPSIAFHDVSQTYIKPVPVAPEDSRPFGHNDAPPSSVFKVEPQIQIQNTAARPKVAPENLPGVMMEPVTPIAPTVPKPAIPEVRSQMQFSPELAPEVRPSLHTAVASGGVVPEFLKVEPQMQKPIPVVPSEPKPVSAPITSYSADPYREPIDEPPGN